MTRRNTATLAVLLIGLAAVIGALVVRNRSARVPEHPRIKLHVGFLPHHAYLPFFAAQAFETCGEVGLDLELQRFESSPTMGSSFAEGKLDAVGMATATALVNESRDPGNGLIFGLTSETKEAPLTGIVVPAGSGANTLEDLRGKRVGVFPGPAASTLFGIVFSHHGLERDRDVQFVELPPNLQASAFRAGEIAALATYEPTVTQLVVTDGAKLLMRAPVESEVLSPTQGGAWMISRSFLKARPQQARDFVSCVAKAVQLAAADPARARTVLARFLEAPPQVLESVPLLRYSFGADIDASALQQYSDLMFKAGVISKRIAVEGMLLGPMGE